MAGVGASSSSLQNVLKVMLAGLSILASADDDIELGCTLVKQCTGRSARTDSVARSTDERARGSEDNSSRWISRSDANFAAFMCGVIRAQ